MRCAPLLLLLTACIHVDLDPGDTSTEPTPTPTPTPSTVLDTAAEETGDSGVVQTIPGGDTVVDLFYYTPAAIDVLFVVDDSGSMADEQAALAASAGTLIDALTSRSFDFHIGVITTDMQDASKSGRLQPDAAGTLWIDEATAAPLTNLQGRVRVGIGGSAVEQGLEAARAALEDHDPGFNTGFRRVGAQLAVVVLSDEDDSSPMSTVDYATKLSTAVPSPADVTFTSFVGGAGCPGTAAGVRYLDVTTQLDGAVGDVCDADLSDELDDLMGLVWNSAPFALSDTPDQTTIMVLVDDGVSQVVLDPTAWAYDAIGNTLRIRSFSAPAGAAIEVIYEPL